MAHIIIDRRKNSKGKSTDNRQRFVKRVKAQVRDAVKKSIREGNIKDIVDEKKGKNVHIPGKGLSQPEFRHSKSGGIRDGVYPGNKEFEKGDRIDRPEGGGAGGGGGDAGDSGEGEDDFTFSLTKKEFLDIFFEDLGLPDLSKKSIVKTEEWTNQRRGFSVTGNPSRLNILRSMKMSRGRLSALRTPKKRKIKELQTELQHLEDSLVIYHKKEGEWEIIDHKGIETRIDEIHKEIKELRRKAKAVPFLDDMDLRYNRWEKVPIPSTQAAMFAIMDVSGSMMDWEKEMAKRFFMILYLFLERKYERVDIIFIRHHTIASEVDEEEFFYSKETGGTIVSSGLEKMLEIIKDRYSPTLWNIYACQASDGDDWPNDLPVASDLMEKEILPLVQYYAYVEIKKSERRESDLWPYYEKLANKFQHFAMAVITDVATIFPVFRGLFKKDK